MPDEHLVLACKQRASVEHFDAFHATGRAIWVVGKRRMSQVDCLIGHGCTLHLRTVLILIENRSQMQAFIQAFKKSRYCEVSGRGFYGDA